MIGEGLPYLSRALLFLTIITKIDLSDNNIGPISAAILGKSIRFNQSLKILILKNNKF